MIIDPQSLSENADPSSSEVVDYEHMVSIENDDQDKTMGGETDIINSKLAMHEDIRKTNQFCLFPLILRIEIDLW